MATQGARRLIVQKYGGTSVGSAERITRSAERIAAVADAGYDVVVVFYDALVPSPGVISEMNYALQTGKRVYGVWLPTSPPSPGQRSTDRIW